MDEMDIQMVTDTDDLELHDRFIDLSFLRLCKMYLELKQAKQRRVRRWRVNPINQESRHNSIKAFKTMSDEDFFTSTKMPRPIFDLLLNLIGKHLRKSRQSIDAEERLAITLAYLGHGTSFHILADSRNLGKTTVRNIVLETCEVLWLVLSPLYMKEPTSDDYSRIEQDFNRIWDIPNCVGGIATKQIQMRRKEENRTILNAMLLTVACDANYNFTAVSVKHAQNDTYEGSNGLTPFGDKTNLEELPLPPKKPLSIASPQPFPHYFIAYSPFPFKSNIMWPFKNTENEGSKLVFNTRLFPAQSLVENTIGILSARWRILLTTIEILPENCEAIVLACVVLHNFMMKHDTEQCYCPSNYVDSVSHDGTDQEGEWRMEIKAEGFKPLQAFTSHARNYSNDCREFRNKLVEHFLAEVELEL